MQLQSNRLCRINKRSVQLHLGPVHRKNFYTRLNQCNFDLSSNNKAMKPLLITCIASMAVLLQGCLVKSLHPFFKETDIVFKTELLSTWTDQDGNKWLIKPYEEKNNAYKMHYLHHGEKDVVMLAHLFKLNEELYLDFFPLTDNEEETLLIFDLHLLPTHSVAKVDMISATEIQIKWFNEDWLKSLFDQNRIKISHEEIPDEASKDENDKSYVLTASTDELQKFIIKYGHEDAAFDNNNTVWLRLKKSI